MAFKPVSSAVPAPNTPLELFDELPRIGDAVPELWRQQGDILRDYANKFIDLPHVAVELPTGTGKTMVGLLVAEWRRRRFTQPVVYACPTQQLVYQVSEVARREGIQAVTLVGSHHLWAADSRARYDAAEAVALTTYSSVFNTSPKLGRPNTIVFDDAHAGEQFVAEAWSIRIDRRDQDGAVYDAVLNAVQGALDGMFLQRLRSKWPDAVLGKEIKLVVPSRRVGMVARLDEALAGLEKGTSPWWNMQLVRQGLGSCLVYVSHGSILVRPFIPPTYTNEPFSEAQQRLYLSATLGRAGELERAFGQGSISRLALPQGSSNPRSGRRYFVFTDLVSNGSEDVASRIVTRAGKALVLAQSTELALQAARDLNVGGWPLLEKHDVAQSLKPFAEADHALLALAGRYDGIDLPDKACRLVDLEGLPDAAHLQERFLAANVRARSALEERKRTRVVQGAGRATRNPSDHAVVLVRGYDLTRYLTNPTTRAALDPDVQSELAFGLENSRGVSADEVLEQVNVFLEQGDEWRENAEPHLAEARRRMVRVDAVGSQQLADAAPHEVAACAAAWSGDFVAAREEATLAVQALSGVDELRSYRALWTYFAAVWSFAAGDADPYAGRTGAGLLQEAKDAARGTTWLRETDPGDVIVEEDANDTPAVKAIAGMLESGVKKATVEKQLDEIRTGLAAIEHTQSEPALTDLGLLLGAEAAKPGGQGRADSVWCWGERIWIALEAKTEQNPDREVSLKDIRQANTQLSMVSADRGVAGPELRADIIISPRRTVAPEGVASATAEVFLAHPQQLRDMAQKAEKAWEDLMTRHRGHKGVDLENLVRAILAQHGLLPTQVLEALTGDPIKP